MGRTIIQPIGPLYGEAVNGTVFGRPNGSIYIPQSNTIQLKTTGDYIKNSTTSGGVKCIFLCNSAGTTIAANIVAQSQDNSAYILREVATDEDFTSVLATSAASAGSFNLSNVFTFIYNTEAVISDETTYYVRASLIASTGVPVATSDVITVTGVVLE